MNTQELFTLLQKANDIIKAQERKTEDGRHVLPEVTHAVLANALGCSTKTISKWEILHPPKELSNVESRNAREFFQPYLLEEKLRRMVGEAHKCVPSEMVAIWLVDGADCILLPQTSYIHWLQKKGGFLPKSVIPLYSQSLTTYPLRSGKFINLAGNFITKHKAKKFPSRGSFMFEGGVCESVLHVPAFIDSMRGPRPVLLLSFENKFIKSTSEENKEVDRLVEGDSRETIYTKEDEETASQLAEKFRDELKPSLKLLGMLD